MYDFVLTPHGAARAMMPRHEMAAPVPLDGFIRGIEIVAKGVFAIREENQVRSVWKFLAESHSMEMSGFFCFGFPRFHIPPKATSI